MQYEIHYGKADVKVYRTYGDAADRHHPDPRVAVRRADEHADGGRDRGGRAGRGLPGRLHQGDNRLVVATDTMKNFIHAASQAARPRRWRAGCTDIGSRLPGRRTRTWSG